MRWNWKGGKRIRDGKGLLAGGRGTCARWCRGCLGPCVVVVLVRAVRSLRVCIVVSSQQSSSSRGSSLPAGVLFVAAMVTRSSRWRSDSGHGGWGVPTPPLVLLQVCWCELCSLCVCALWSVVFLCPVATCRGSDMDSKLVRR